MPPAIAQACRTALGLLRADEALVSGLRANIGGVRKVFARLGLPLPPEGVPIFTFTLATHARMQRVHELLHEAGVLAPLIDYPGGRRRCISASSSTRCTRRSRSIAWAPN